MALFDRTGLSLERRHILLLGGLLVTLLSRNVRRKLVLGSFLPLVFITDVCNRALRLRWWKTRSRVSSSAIDESKFPDEQEFSRILDRIGGHGVRTTGSKTHNELVGWLEAELRKIPGIEIRKDEFEIKRWQTLEEDALEDAGTLIIESGDGKQKIPVVGAVPFSLSTSCSGKEMIYVPGNIQISKADVRGKVILRDFPVKPIPYALGLIPSYSKTADLNADLLSDYDRPGFADGPLDRDLVEAGAAGAAGMIIMFDVVREHVASYFEPHKGVHYQLPALFVGVDEAIQLKTAHESRATASITIAAETQQVKTCNLIATLPGQIPERIIYLSHTDGNTYVQENGAVSLLTLAQYYAAQPLSGRRRTLEFAFNTGHLHISREGSARHANELNSSYEDGTTALIIPIEHLGTREVEAVKRPGSKPGRELRFTGRGEVMFWCVGPSPVVVRAVEDAVRRRGLDRVVVTRGVSMPNPSQVPTFTSFGGIGTYYHDMLLPTTSLISGPWSLWAPYFGREAVHVGRLRRQTMAVGDLYLALDGVARTEVSAGYEAYREVRAKGGKVFDVVMPTETPDARVLLNM